MPTSTNGKTWGVAGELEEPVNELNVSGGRDSWFVWTTARSDEDED